MLQLEGRIQENMITRELSPGRKPCAHFVCSRNGFSLAELMVVLVIIAILMAISVPVIKNGQSQRELANSVAYMSTNLQWAMAEARKSGQTIYMGFKWRYDRNQIEAPLDYDVNSDSPLDGGPPDNPGIARVAALLAAGRLVVAPSCRNLIEEFGRYAYATDADGNPTGRVVKAFDHALDALRYAVVGLQSRPAARAFVQVA